MVPISQSKRYIDLEKKMHALKIFEKDLKEEFVRSSGPGGQNINKVATCVQLQHIPTGIHIKCQDYRTQMLNRYKAREILIDKVFSLRDKQERQEKYLKEKIKRQKRGRTKKGKELMLVQKKQQSEKKQLRKKVDVRKGGDEF